MLGDDPRSPLDRSRRLLWSQSHSGLEIARVGLQQVRELGEELLEAGGGDDAGSSVSFQKVCHTSRGL